MLSVSIRTVLYACLAMLTSSLAVTQEPRAPGFVAPRDLAFGDALGEVLGEDVDEEVVPVCGRRSGCGLIAAGSER